MTGKRNPKKVEFVFDERSLVTPEELEMLMLRIQDPDWDTSQRNDVWEMLPKLVTALAQSNSELTLLRAQLAAGAAQGWRLLDIGEIIEYGDEYLDDATTWRQLFAVQGNKVVKGDVIRRRFPLPTPDGEAARVDLGDGNMPSVGAIKELIKIARMVANHADEYPDDMEEDANEFILCPDESDKHPLTLGMLHRLAGALALVSPLRRDALAAAPTPQEETK